MYCTKTTVLVTERHWTCIGILIGTTSENKCIVKNECNCCSYQYNVLMETKFYFKKMYSVVFWESLKKTTIKIYNMCQKWIKRTDHVISQNEDDMRWFLGCPEGVDCGDK